MNFEIYFNFGTIWDILPLWDKVAIWQLKKIEKLGYSKFFFTEFVHINSSLHNFFF